MAKTLHRPPPTSSIARLLDTEAAVRAISAANAPVVAPAEPRRRPTSAHVNGDSHLSMIKREVTLTAATDETLTKLVELYRRTTGTRLSTSHVARVMLRAIAHCMGPIEREARRVGRCRLPANAKGREAEREHFEHRLALALVEGMRTAASFSSDVA